MPKRIDANQQVIVKAIRGCGFSVQILSDVGHGCPDAIIGAFGTNLLFEFKDGDKPPSQQRLTEDEKKFHDSWKGQVCIVRSVQEAIDTINKLSRMKQVLCETS